MSKEKFTKKINRLEKIFEIILVIMAIVFSAIPFLLILFNIDISVWVYMPIYLASIMIAFFIFVILTKKLRKEIRKYQDNLKNNYNFGSYQSITINSAILEGKEGYTAKRLKKMFGVS